MREIKFRSWFECGYLREHNFVMGLDGVVYELETDGEAARLGLVHDVVLEQYTGLKDKNGVEIYEGDILMDDHEEYHWIVRFDDSGCFVAHMPGEECDWVLLDDYGFEVIGNIHETGNY